MDPINKSKVFQLWNISVKVKIDQREDFFLFLSLAYGISRLGILHMVLSLASKEVGSKWEASMISHGIKKLSQSLIKVHRPFGYENKGWGEVKRAFIKSRRSSLLIPLSSGDQCHRRKKDPTLSTWAEQMGSHLTDDTEMHYFKMVWMDP